MIIGIASYIFTEENCKSIKIIKAFKDFGSEHIKGCFSVATIKQNAKEIFIDSPILYENSKFIYELFFKKKSNKMSIDTLIDINKNEIKTFEPKKYQYTKGILEENRYNNLFKEIKNKNIENNKEYSSWLRSHGGNWNTKYSHNQYINLSNVKSLKLIWKFSSIKKNEISKKWRENVEINPIFIKNNLIFITADRKIISTDGISGKINWELQSLFSPGRRGIVSEIDSINKKNFLYLPINGKIYKIDTQDGKLVKKFGKNGSIDATTVVAPVIYKNYLIVVTYDNKSVYMFDKISGSYLYSIPLFNEKRNFIGGTPWAGIAFDELKGILFISTGNPQPGTYGANRKGSNDKSSSLIAVDVIQKKILWYFQETFHDLWDYDVASPPILHDLKINDQLLEIVLVPTKAGNTILLERNTGIPIFNIEYKNVKYYSDIPGEIVSKYQLNLKLPEPFANTEYKKTDITNLNENQKNQIIKKLEEANIGEFHPPSFNKNTIVKGLHGGAEWQGGAIDPIEQYFYLPVNNVPWVIRPYMYATKTNTPDKFKNLDGYNIYQQKCSSCHGLSRNGIFQKKGEKKEISIPSLVGISLINKEDFYKKIKMKFVNFHNQISISNLELNKIFNSFQEWDQYLYDKKLIKVEGQGNSWYQFLTDDGLPAINPPWGYIAKIDLVSGKLVWKTPIGYKNFKGKKILIGTPNFGGLAINGSGIIFYTGTDDNYFYAINSKTGEVLWEYEMDAAGSAPPIIFEYNGKQYVSIISTGGIFHNFKNKDSTIYTFGIN